MFPPKDTPTLTRRVAKALRLAQAFLLLEDEIDWEVDPQEPCAHRSRRRQPAWEEPAGRREHPHRVPLRLQPRSRRPGAVMSREQVCLCPVQRTPKKAPQGRQPSDSGDGLRLT